MCRPTFESRSWCPGRRRSPARHRRPTTTVTAATPNTTLAATSQGDRPPVADSGGVVSSNPSSRRPGLTSPCSRKPLALRSDDVMHVPSFSPRPDKRNVSGGMGWFAVTRSMLTVSRTNSSFPRVWTSTRRCGNHTFESPTFRNSESTVVLTYGGGPVSGPVNSIRATFHPFDGMTQTLTRTCCLVNHRKTHASSGPCFSPVTAGGSRSALPTTPFNRPCDRLATMAG